MTVHKLGNLAPGHVVMLFKSAFHVSPATRLVPGEPIMVIGPHDKLILNPGERSPSMGIVVRCLTQHGIRYVRAYAEVKDFDLV